MLRRLQGYGPRDSKGFSSFSSWRSIHSIWCSLKARLFFFLRVTGDRQGPRESLEKRYMNLGGLGEPRIILSSNLFCSVRVNGDHLVQWDPR